MTDEDIRKAACEAWDVARQMAYVMPYALVGDMRCIVEAVYRAGLDAGRAEAAAAKPKRRKAAADGATVEFAELVAAGVAPHAAADWLHVRKQHKAPLTRTAWEATKREARAAGMDVGEAVRLCAERSWRGFLAKYVDGSLNGRTESARAREARERVERVAPGAAARRPGAQQQPQEWIDNDGTKRIG